MKIDINELEWFLIKFFGSLLAASMVVSALLFLYIDSILP